MIYQPLMRTTHSIRGFTLIETILYIALFAMLMSGAVVAAYNLLEGGNRNKTAIGIQEEGTFINRKIHWALTGASNAVVSGGGNTLTITRPDLGAQSPLVIYGNGTTVTIARGATGLEVALNSERYPVSAPVSGPLFTLVPPLDGRPASITSSYVIQGKPFIFRTYVRQ